ncbi:IS66 family insertion sequence element accessory protein TnpB, partial [Tabrizicola oligotrophica]
MIFPSNRVRIMVATKPIDFRKGHDSLAAMVKNELRKDPFTGTVFVFRARKADRLKLLYWDGTGLVMAYKRLEEHSFTWPAVKDGLMLMNHAQFEALFAGLDWRRVPMRSCPPPSPPSSKATGRGRSTICSRGITPSRCDRDTAYGVCPHGSQMACPVPRGRRRGTFQSRKRPRPRCGAADHGDSGA